MVLRRPLPALTCSVNRVNNYNTAPKGVDVLTDYALMQSESTIVDAGWFPLGDVAIGDVRRYFVLAANPAAWSNQ